MLPDAHDVASPWGSCPFCPQAGEECQPLTDSKKESQKQNPTCTSAPHRPSPEQVQVHQFQLASLQSEHTVYVQTMQGYEQANSYMHLSRGDSSYPLGCKPLPHLVSCADLCIDDLLVCFQWFFLENLQLLGLWFDADSSGRGFHVAGTFTVPLKVSPSFYRGES